MAGGRLVLPATDPVLTSGNLLNVGATLTVFLTGTNTLASIYGDLLLTSPLENPQTSNSAGRFYEQATQICADASAAYDVNLVLTDGETFFYSNLYVIGAPVNTSGFLQNPNVALTGVPTAPTPAANDSSSSIATTAFVAAALGLLNVFPVGMYGYFAMTSLPAGWLLCNGSAVSRATYAALFGAIGTTYGIGDGTTTFNLPNFQGYFPRGQNTTGTGPDPSRALGNIQTDAFQGHYHAPLAPATADYGRSASGTTGIPSGAGAAEPATTGSPVTDTVNGTPRTATETRPSNLAVVIAIKT